MPERPKCSATARVLLRRRHRRSTLAAVQRWLAHASPRPCMELQHITTRRGGGSERAALVAHVPLAVVRVTPQAVTFRLVHDADGITSSPEAAPLPRGLQVFEGALVAIALGATPLRAWLLQGLAHV